MVISVTVTVNLNHTGVLSGKESCKSTELKRWSATEIRWNKYKVSLGSFETLLSRRLSSEKNEVVDVLNPPRLSTAMGWIVYAEDRLEY